MHKETQMNTSSKRSVNKMFWISAGLAGCVAMGGCSNAGEGLFSGAALGATTGLIIGSMNGQAGEGAALGAVLGAVGGSIIGDQNDRNEQNSRRHHHHQHNDPWWASDDWDD